MEDRAERRHLPRHPAAGRLPHPPHRREEDGPRDYEAKFLPKIGPWALYGLLFTIVILFALQGKTITSQPLDVVRIALPLLVYFAIMFFGTFLLGKGLGLAYDRTATARLHRGGQQLRAGHRGRHRHLRRHLRPGPVRRRRPADRGPGADRPGLRRARLAQEVRRRRGDDRPVTQRRGRGGDRRRPGRARRRLPPAPPGPRLRHPRRPGRAGGAWQHTWDSLRLFSPAAYSSLPGRLMPAQPGEEYPDAGHVVDYLTDYEQRYELPVHRPVARRRRCAATVTGCGSRRTPAPGRPGRSSARPAPGGAPSCPPSPASRDFTRPPAAHRRATAAPPTSPDSGWSWSAAATPAHRSPPTSPHDGVDLTWVTQRPPRFLADDIDGRALFDAATARRRALDAGRTRHRRRRLARRHRRRPAGPRGPRRRTAQGAADVRPPHRRRRRVGRRHDRAEARRGHLVHRLPPRPVPPRPAGPARPHAATSPPTAPAPSASRACTCSATATGPARPPPPSSASAAPPATPPARSPTSWCEQTGA